MAEEFYAEHAGKPFFEGLVTFMSRQGAAVAALVACRNTTHFGHFSDHLCQEWTGDAGTKQTRGGRGADL